MQELSRDKKNVGDDLARIVSSGNADMECVFENRLRMVRLIESQIKTKGTLQLGVYHGVYGLYMMGK